ncbi:extracellular solute-binding protein [Halopenitus sp. POP-27]|uniref:ABC transporter substrate-binding protein n=1 Tax=Halopenitus sp. POP-27 TaxID=2994425 RepID=UPI0024687154|nr:extracellular solute-binding protein [Halopenitus sp. POP-27]
MTRKQSSSRADPTPSNDRRGFLTKLGVVGGLGTGLAGCLGNGGDGGNGGNGNGNEGGSGGGNGGTQGSTGSGDRTLTILGYNFYYPDSIVEPFEEEHGVDVEVISLTTNSEAVGLMRTQYQGEVDVIGVTNNWVEPLWNADLVQPIPTDDMSHFGNMVERARTAPGCVIDGTQTAIPYAYGMTGPMYRTDVIDEEPDELSWDYLFDPDVIESNDLDGRIAMRDWPIAAFADAGYYLGDDHPHPPSDLEACRDALEAAFPAYRTLWSTQDQHLKLIANEEVVVQHGWDLTGFLAMDQGHPVEMAVPPGGTDGYADAHQLATDAPNPDLAVEFMDHYSSPDASIQQMRNAGNLPINLDARDRMTETERDHRSVVLENEDRLRMRRYFGDEELETAQQMWQELKG